MSEKPPGHRWARDRLLQVALLTSLGGLGVGLWSQYIDKPQPKTPATPAAGAPMVNPLGMRFRYIPAGTFTIGSPAQGQPGGPEPGRFDDETLHQVRLTRGFWLGETEVTQGQWKQLVGNNPSRFKACGDHCPVENVSWWDVVAFANKLSEQEGLARCYELAGCTGALGSSDFKCTSATFVGLECPGYRLPTESEWEVSARSGTQTAIYTGALTLKGRFNGPELDPIAWYGGNSGVTYSGAFDCTGELWIEKQYPEQKSCGPHPVGEKTANPYGLSDMLGNVWEWTWDWQGDYPASLSVDPQGPPVGSVRVMRGGSWYFYARHVRAASRFWYSPELRDSFVGFRLARGQASAK